MSTTVTNTSGVQTRGKLRSNSETLRPISEMAATLENLATRKRATRRTLPSRASPDHEDLPSSPPGDDVFVVPESIAAQVWNQIFQVNFFTRMTENSDYMRRVVSTLLESAELETVRTGVMESIREKRADFITTEERNTDKLKERILKLFTSILMREVREALAEKKKVIEDKVTEMAANRVRRQDALNWYKEKQNLKSQCSTSH